MKSLIMIIAGLAIIAAIVMQAKRRKKRHESERTYRAFLGYGGKEFFREK